MKWDVERIRAEIARLDALTGLNGRDMLIQIGAARQTLGCFSAKSKDSMFFRFSAHFFEADSFSNAEALDTIAHEYAHYMDYVLNGPNLSHGESWKACCRIVGARPMRLYQPAVNSLHLAKERAESEEMRRMDEMAARFAINGEVIHAVYGRGKIRDIVTDGKNSRIMIAFPSAGVKTFSLGWMAEHCRISANNEIYVA